MSLCHSEPESASPPTALTSLGRGGAWVRLARAHGEGSELPVAGREGQGLLTVGLSGSQALYRGGYWLGVQ